MSQHKRYRNGNIKSQRENRDKREILSFNKSSENINIFSSTIEFVNQFFLSNVLLRYIFTRRSVNAYRCYYTVINAIIIASRWLD